MALCCPLKHVVSQRYVPIICLMANGGAAIGKRLDDSSLADSVCACAAGWEEDFDELYRRYYGQIFRYIRGRLLSQANSRVDAEDLAERVFVKLLEKRSFDSTKGDFRAWVYRVARNEIVDYWRATGQHHMLAECDDDDPDFGGQFPSKAPLPDSILERSELLAIMRECINRLRSIDREIIELRTFQERPFRSVAAEINIEENAATVRHHQALHRLRDCFATRMGNGH